MVDVTGCGSSCDIVVTTAPALLRAAASAAERNAVRWRGRGSEQCGLQTSRGPIKPLAPAVSTTALRVPDAAVLNGRQSAANHGWRRSDRTRTSGEVIVGDNVAAEERYDLRPRGQQTPGPRRLPRYSTVQRCRRDWGVTSI
jgi:hypothetical protein